MGRPDEVSTLRHYLNVVWRRKWVFVAVVVVVPIATLVLSLRQSPLYEASADVLVNRQEAATTSLIGQTPALDDAERTLETQANLARVPLVERRTLATAGKGLPRGYDLLSHSSVFPVADLLRFTVSDGDAARAERLVSAYAREFVRYRRELDTVGLAHTLAELRAQMATLAAEGKGSSALYVNLADRVEQLESLRALRSSNVSVVRVAQPGDAVRVAPRPRRDTAVALAAGLVIGLVLVFLWESLTTKPRDEREIEALLDMPFLGRIDLGSSKEHASLARSDHLERDDVNALRANLEFAGPLRPRLIMVSSPRWDEGKSDTLLELAAALARSGRRVAIVDLDFRRSALTGLLGLDGHVGIAAVARGESRLGDAVVRFAADLSAPSEASDAGARPGAEAGDFDVLASGSSAVHPAELLGSDSLAAVLTELAGGCDVVLVDVPPLLEAPDAAAIAPRMDGLLLVVAARRARTPMLAKVDRMVSSWPIAKLGFALATGDSRTPPYGAVRLEEPGGSRHELEHVG